MYQHVFEVLYLSKKKFKLNKFIEVALTRFGPLSITRILMLYLGSY